MADLIDREFIKGLGGECIARRDRETGELIAITGIDLLPSAQPEQLGTDLAEVGTDCISRQEAIETLTEYGNGRVVYISVGEAVRRIEQLPPAQPRPKGKWIPYSKVYENRNRCFECDYHLVGTPAHEANFCPNCGADMRGEQDDSSQE